MERTVKGIQFHKNFRMQKVWELAVFKQMEQSSWDWWGSTDLARDKLIRVLEWLNPEEVEKAKKKFSFFGCITI